MRGPGGTGWVFFVMERRRGLIRRDEIPPLLRDMANNPQVVSEAFVDCLVRLHGIDV